MRCEALQRVELRGTERSRVRAHSLRSLARAIAIDERTAALTDIDGTVSIEGDGNVYFLRARKPAEVCKPGMALTFRGVEVYRVAKGGAFNLKTWAGNGGAAYNLGVDAGVVHSSQPGGAIY